MWNVTLALGKKFDYQSKTSDDTSIQHEYSGAHLETETQSVYWQSYWVCLVERPEHLKAHTFGTCGGNAVTLLLQTWGTQGGKEDAIQAITPCAPVVVVDHPRGTGSVIGLTWLPLELFLVFLPFAKLAECLHFLWVGGAWWFPQLICASWCMWR